MKMPKTETEYTKFMGGLDLETPTISIKPGALIAGMNYVAGSEGGYERIDGYERFDGQAAPSDATYYYCPCTFTAGGPAVGDTIDGAVSLEDAVVIVVGADYICVTKLSGDFNDDEVYTVAAVALGTFNAAQVEKGETSALLHATALNLAADVYRADIAAPTGSSTLRGGIMLAGVNYVFRDNAAGDAGLIYKSTAAGWVNVALNYEISFDTGLVAGIAEGDTVTQLVSGATGLVLRIVHESGTWAGNDAAGRLILSTITGVFNAVNILQVGGTDRCTATSLLTAITITEGGKYDLILYNFTGSTATKRIYGCDGKNRGFEFDGTVYVPIDTGMTVDTPEHVTAYKEHLIFSFKGSSQNSGIGTPYIWSAVLGAAELAIGDNVVGYARQAKGLIIDSRNSTHQLTGSSVADFVLDDVSPETGAIPWTIQTIGKTYCFDDRGMIEVARVQEYGNFALATISGKIQARIDAMRAVAVASSVYRAKDQYRVYGSDGTGICMTVSQGRYGPIYQFTQFAYPNYVACAWSGEDANGKDVVFFGSDAGMVYQADKGSSFDGADIEAYLFLPFNNLKSPSVLKTYRKATVEMTVTAYTSLRYNPVFSYGESTIPAHIAKTLANQLGGGFWGLVDWSEFFWDADIVPSAGIPISGDGINMSLTIYGKSQIDLGHKMNGVTVHYTPRRLIR